MEIRKYIKTDLPQMAELFYNTVHSINTADYSEKEINAWATGKIDFEKWDKAYNESYTLVADDNGIIAGFGNIYSSGYLDMLYVHKDYQHRGIASEICLGLENKFNVNKITVNASITAKPFFEKRGYKVLHKQTVKRNEVNIINYVMELIL